MCISTGFECANAPSFVSQESTPFIGEVFPTEDAWKSLSASYGAVDDDFDRFIDDDDDSDDDDDDLFTYDIDDDDDDDDDW